MTRRRRTGAPGLVLISWRDIPAQVRATGTDQDASALLPPRFQKAIDKAARVAGKTDHHAYIGEWRRTTVPLDPAVVDVQGAVEDLAAGLDRDHDRETLAALVRSGGVRPITETDTEAHTETDTDPADVAGDLR